MLSTQKKKCNKIVRLAMKNSDKSKHNISLCMIHKKKTFYMTVTRTVDSVVNVLCRVRLAAKNTTYIYI